MRGHDPNNILYGRIGRSKQTKDFSSLPLDLQLLLLDQGYMFENVDAFSGGRGWVVKAQQLPAQWKVKRREQYAQPMVHQINMINKYHKKSTSSAFPCDLAILDNEQQAKCFWKEDGQQGQETLSQTVTQRVAAITQVLKAGQEDKDASYQWYMAPDNRISHHSSLFLLDENQEVIACARLL